jgi:protein-S-isoprenylcysteine O-methyltransferase Ste14
MTEMKSLLAAVPQAIAAVALVVLTFSFPVPWNTMHCFGVAITISAAVPFLVARYQLGKSFAIGAQAKQLVTHGIYSRIRNPLYVFSSLMILGAVISYQKPGFLLIPGTLVVVQSIRAHREAQTLEAAFGDDYREYRKRTWF